jgi:hypothetical protein
MGCCASLCRRSAQDDILDQYLSLVVAKPSPVNLEAIEFSDSGDTDVPLFAQVAEDLDAVETPNVEQVSDSPDDPPPPKKSRKHD